MEDTELCKAKTNSNLYGNVFRFFFRLQKRLPNLLFQFRKKYSLEWRKVVMGVVVASGEGCWGDGEVGGQAAISFFNQ